jgi:hypothetical protein
MNRMTFSFERFSLTLALSRGERENCSQIVWHDGSLFRFTDQICVRHLNTIQVSRSDEAQDRTTSGFGNPRYSRFGNLRYLEIEIQLAGSLPNAATSASYCLRVMVIIDP